MHLAGPRDVRGRKSPWLGEEMWQDMGLAVTALSPFFDYKLTLSGGTCLAHGAQGSIIERYALIWPKGLGKANGFCSCPSRTDSGPIALRGWTWPPNVVMQNLTQSSPHGPPLGI